MDALTCNRSYQNFDAGQRLVTGAVNVEGSAVNNQDIVPVDVEATNGLKEIALEQFLLKPNTIPMQLRSATGIEFRDFKVMHKQFKNASEQPAKQNEIAKNFINSVFEKAGMDQKILSNIQAVLGVQDVNGAHGQVAPVVSDASLSVAPQISEEDYIKGLEDVDLDNHRKNCSHVEYDKDTGRYTYDAPMMSRYNRLSSEAHTAFSRHRSSGPRNQFGRVTENTTISCAEAQEMLRTGLNGDKKFVNEDTVVIRTYALLDIHGHKIMSLLNSLQHGIEEYGLPEGVGSLAVKVDVADGYRASYVLKAETCGKGFNFRLENDPDNLVASDHLLTITFNKKSDLSDLISGNRFYNFTPSGKSLSDLESNKQVSLKLESGYNEAVQSLIMTLARGLSVQSDDLIDNKAQFIKAKTYFYSDGRFGKPVGGGR